MDGSPTTFHRLTNQNHSSYFITNFQYPTSHKKNISMGRFVYHKRYPYFTSEFNCTVMLLVNFASSEWVNVRCEEELIPFAVCTTRKPNNDLPNYQTDIDRTLCPETQIKCHKTCFLAQWIDPNLGGIPESGNLALALAQLENTNEESFFANILQLSPIISPSGHCFEFDRLLNKHTKSVRCNSTKSPGYRLIVSPVTEIKRGRDTFTCANNMSISPLKVCDGADNCSDNSDEHFCLCTTSGPNCTRKILRDQTRWKMKSLCKGKSHCLTLLEMIAKGMNLFDTAMNYAKQYSCQSSGGGISSGHSDVLALLGKKSRAIGKDPNKIACQTGDQSFNISDLCIHKLNKQNNSCPCIDGTHLASCKEFECNMMFKCPNYFCIPWQYVCDKKWDCPAGTDELHCGEYYCVNMFKCNSVKMMCIHLGQVCNGIEDCPEGEDEILCDLKGLQCPSTNCDCLLVAIICFQTNIHTLQIEKFYFVQIINSTFEREYLHQLQTVRSYMLIHSNMTIKCNFFKIETLLDLNFQHNRFDTIKTHCFKVSQHLKFIRLMNNQIEMLEPKAFANLSILQFLNLSQNLLFDLPSESFHNLPKLKVLSLLENSLVDIESDAFEALSLHILETFDHRLCCIVPPSTQCNATRPWHVSCSDLLPNMSVKVTFITMSIFIVLLNIFSVLLFLASKTERNRSNIVVTISVNINEVVPGLYLGILWITDICLKIAIVLQEDTWKSHIGCHIASFFIFLFVIADPTFLFFLSVARLMIVKHPIESQFKLTSFVFKCVSIIEITVFVLAVSVNVIHYFTVHMMPTSLCLIFVDPANISIFSVIITFVIAFLQLITSIAIVITYCLLVKEFYKSKKNVGGTTGFSDKANRTLVIQLVIITASNVLCWIPTNIIYLCSLFMSRYPSEMVTWTAVAVAPLNAVVNPTVFLITSAKTIHRRRTEEKKTPPKLC